MLAQILPGIRQVRTPLVAGALWLFVVWLLFRGHLPTKAEATGIWADLYHLAGALGQPVLLATLAVTAYVVGARVSGVIEEFQDAIRNISNLLLSRWRPSVVRGFIPPQIDAVISEVATRYPSPDLDDIPHLRSLYRTAIDQSVAEAKFRWPAEAPDLFQEYDRRESERDFAYGISVPLATLAFTLATTNKDWMVLALALVAIALLSKRAGYQHQRELERFVLEAVMVGRVRSDLTDLLVNWSEMADVRLIARPPA